MEFKIGFINQFNKMEEKLKSQSQTPTITSYMINDPIERAKKWIEEQQQTMLLAETVQEQSNVIEHKEIVIAKKTMKSWN